MNHIVRPMLEYMDRRPGWLLLGYILLVTATSLSVSHHGAESGDLWIGLECGRYTVAGDWAANDPHRTCQMRLLDHLGLHLTFRDPFSQASRGYDPNSLTNCGWINQNWLSHVLLYKMRMAFGAGPVDIGRGETLIVLFKILQVMAIGLLVGGTARLLGTHPALSTAAAVLALMVGATYFDLRPNTNSLVLASIMMVIFAARSRSQTGTVIYWMIPLMALWANLHGGFVYAIMAYGTACICESVGYCLQCVWPRCCARISRRKILHLFLGTALLLVVPMVFSPFGARNLFHPLLVSTGEDAKIFRQISEWQPTWQAGFGDVQFFYFLFSGFVVLGGLWFLMWLWLNPAQRMYARTEWPKLDLAEIGVLALTLAMGVTTRRFVPLAGIVVAPYLARLVQEIGCMAAPLRVLAAAESLWKARRNLCAPLAAGLSAAAGLWVLATCRGQVVELYRALQDGGGDRTTPFKYVAAAYRHPAQAAQFLDANKVAGAVLNDWIDGGFLAFQQTPDPRTGAPRCKVYVDGRSQAAYDVRHYLWWKLLHSVPSPSYPQKYGLVETEARRRCLDPTDIVFLEQLRREYVESRGKARSEGEPSCDIGYLLGLALSHPVAFDRMLLHEHINVVLLALRDQADFQLLDQLPDWTLAYMDARDCIFLRRDGRSNQRLLDGDPNALIYPSPVARGLSVGLRYCRGTDPVRCRQGVRLLMGIGETIPRQYINRRQFVPGLVDRVFDQGVRLGMHEELRAYLTQQARVREQATDSGTDTTRQRILVDLYRKLADLATIDWQYEQARDFMKLARQHLTP
jgi:hypothetical protein